MPVLELSPINIGYYVVARRGFVAAVTVSLFMHARIHLLTMFVPINCQILHNYKVKKDGIVVLKILPMTYRILFKISLKQ